MGRTNGCGQISGTLCGEKVPDRVRLHLQGTVGAAEAAVAEGGPWVPGGGGRLAAKHHKGRLGVMEIVCDLHGVLVSQVFHLSKLVKLYIKKWMFYSV